MTTTYDGGNPCPGLGYGYSKGEKGDANIKNTQMVLNGWKELVKGHTKWK